MSSILGWGWGFVLIVALGDGVERVGTSIVANPHGELIAVDERGIAVANGNNTRTETACLSVQPGSCCCNGAAGSGAQAIEQRDQNPVS